MLSAVTPELRRYLVEILQRRVRQAAHDLDQACDQANALGLHESAEDLRSLRDACWMQSGNLHALVHAGDDDPL